MTFFNGILLSGWFQIILLSIGFFAYSRAILKRKLIRGYALGWMLGLFFIFTYTAVNPPQTLQLGGFDRELNLMQIMFASMMGIFLSLGMAVLSSALRTSYRWQALQAAAITGMLVTSIFIQIIGTPDLRLMISIFVLAFAMTALASLILRGDRAIETENEPAYSGYDNPQSTDEPVSHVNRMRQRIMQRVNRNSVPTSHPVSPTAERNQQ